MALKWGGRKKQDGAEQTAPEKPERSSNKLDYVLVAENKQKSKLSLDKLKAHKRVVLVAAVLVLAVAGGGAAMWYVRHKNVGEQQSKDFQALMASVKDLRNQGKDGEAQVQLSQFNDKYPDQTQEQRFRVASELAAIYGTSGDFKNTVKWQQIAFNNNPNPGYGDYLALGEAYTFDRNDAEAIKYLQLALDALKAEDKNGDGGPRGRFLQHQIDLLKKGRQR